MNNCQEQNSEEYLINSNVENKNDKGIQCDMDNETNTDAIESFDFPSDISSTDDESETTYEEDEEQLDYLSAKTHSLEKVDKPMNISENVSVPQNIVLLPKPDLVEMREKKYSRFSNK
ncbi:hypothetical protein QTP88_019988 [Uroleucon formosanum]